jgi:hypothetical protein
MNNKKDTAVRTLTKMMLLVPLAAWPVAGQTATDLSVSQLNQLLNQLKARQADDARELQALENELHELQARQGAHRHRSGAKKHPPALAHDGAAQPPVADAATPKAAPLAAATTASQAAGGGEEMAGQAATPEKAAHAQSQSIRSVTQTDQPFADSGRRLTIDTGLTYAHYDRKQLELNGFLALGAIFLGEINVDNVKADTLTWDTTARYSLTDRLQLDFNAPFLYRYSVYQATGANNDSKQASEQNVSMNWAVGDVSSGIYYKWLTETADRPEVVFNGRIKVPTGSNPYGIKMVTAPDNSSLQTPARLASGNGLWTASTGVSVSKTLDPAVIFTSLNYFHNQKRHFGDISDQLGSMQPGEVDLGDAWQFGVGTAFALNEKMSLSLSYLQRIQRQSRFRPDGSNWKNIVGSDADAAVLNLGGAYALSRHKSVVFNLGAGLTPDAPNVQIGLRYVQTF